MQESDTFPELVKRYRKQQGYTQAEAAIILGYSRDTIAAWECGRRLPVNTDIPRLAALFEVDQTKLAQMINTARLQAYQQKMYMEADAESTGELTGRAAYDDHRRAYLSQTAARLEREKQALQTFSPLLAASQGEAMTLDLLHVLPQELQVMSSISRRQLIELGIAVLIIRLAQLDGKRISAIDREESGWSLGKSVADGWKLFLEAGNPQMRSVLSMKNLTSPAGYKLPGKMHLWPVTMFGPFLT